VRCPAGLWVNSVNGPTSDLRVVDVHSHHYPLAFEEACLDPANGLTTRRRSDGGLAVMIDGAVSLVVPVKAPTVAERLDLLDVAGIGVQLLSLSAPNVYHFDDELRITLARQTNDELIEIARTSSGRLPALVSLPLPDVDAALAELDRVIDLPGVAGVFLCTTVRGRPLDDPEFRPLLEELSRREVSVLVHPTVGCATNLEAYALSLNIGFMAETTNCVARLLFSGTLESLPGITWIFSHLGGTLPFLHHRIEKANKAFGDWQIPLEQTPAETLASVYFDTVTDHQPALVCALDTYGANALLFGTDYPHGPPDLRGPVGLLTRTISDRESLAAVMGGTAERIFSLTASTTGAA
jgi:predicted TIM-barrel fold metal-dependent hydrolase